jgi:hypothetical protein
MNPNKIMNRRCLLIAALLSIGVISSPAAMAAGQCLRFSLTSNVTLLGPTGPAVGYADVVMEDGRVLRVSASGDITDSKLHDDGTIHMRVRELDNWGLLGTTLGLDKIHLTPTVIPGEYTLTIKTHILGTTGALEEVFGKYHGQGTASFASGQVTHSGAGKICNLPY